jgi:hypothetical protein
MSIHLSDEETTAAAAGERPPRTAHHLQICAECQEQVAEYRRRLAQLRLDVCYGAGRSALDWGRQSRHIRTRIVTAQIEHTERRNKSFAIISTALAAALILCLFVFRPTLSTISTSAQVSDAALLAGVEARVNEDLPDGLQPADVLVGEMGGLDAPAKSSYPHKTRRKTE